MVEIFCDFDFEIKHIKVKENKVVDSLRRKFHVTTISMSKLDLRTRVLDALVEDGHYP